MNKDQINNKSTLPWRDIIIMTIITIGLLVLPILYYAGAIDNENAVWAGVAVTQIGVALLWLFIRMGMFSTSSYGSRKLARGNVERKQRKLAYYANDDFKDKKPLKYKSPYEVEDASRKKSKLAIWIMIAIGLVELTVALLINFI